MLTLTPIYEPYCSHQFKELILIGNRKGFMKNNNLTLHILYFFLFSFDLLSDFIQIR